MKKLNFLTKLVSTAAVAALLLTSCNKGLETIATPDGTPVQSATGNIGATIASNPNDSLFYKLLQRSTLLPLLTDSSKRFTINAVDNAGMRIFVNAASGGAVPLASPDPVFAGFISANLPVATAAAIVQYNVIGQFLPTSVIPVKFPNTPYSTQIVLDPNNPFLRMNTTYSKTASNINYVNNIPSFGQNDQPATNGIIHHTFTLVTPPSQLLSQIIAPKTNLTYYRQALIRADSGQDLTTTNSFQFQLGYGILNMTALAPSDAAFQTFIYTIAFGKTLQALGVTPATATPAQLAIANTQANGAVAAGPAFLMTNNVTTEQVRGVIAYHILASPSTLGSISPNIRVFSVNVPTTPTLVKTLVNSSAAGAAHPGVRAVATFTGPVATSVTFTGFSALTGGAPFTDTPANVTEKDLHGVNGILHVIDRVLVPLPL